MADQKPDHITDAQWKRWLNDLRGAASGNPYATMCRHCSIRHAPPRDEDCPRFPNPGAGERS